MKSHPLRLSAKCPACDHIFFIDTLTAPSDCTMDCANESCRALLRLKDGCVYVFHEQLHHESNSQWPKDGAGTAHVEFAAGTANEGAKNVDAGELTDEEKVRAISFVVDSLNALSKRLLDAGEYRKTHLPPTFELLDDLRRVFVDKIKRKPL